MGDYYDVNEHATVNRRKSWFNVVKNDRIRTCKCKYFFIITY